MVIFLFPPPLPALFIFTLPSFSGKILQISQLSGYMKSVTTWGPEALLKSHSLGRSWFAQQGHWCGRKGEQRTPGQDQKASGDQCVELKGEEQEVSLKEACRSCIQCIALLLGFSWPSKTDPLGGWAERRCLLLLSYRTIWHHVASPFENFFYKTFHCNSE